MDAHFAPPTVASELHCSTTPPFAIDGERHFHHQQQRGHHHRHHHQPQRHSASTPPSVELDADPVEALASTSPSAATVQLAWARSHRPERVLDAPGIPDDFYTSPVAWGQDRVCAALGSQVLLFDPADTADMAAFSNTPALGEYCHGAPSPSSPSTASSGSSDSTTTSPPRGNSSASGTPQFVRRVSSPVAAASSAAGEGVPSPSLVAPPPPSSGSGAYGVSGRRRSGAFSSSPMERRGTFTAPPVDVSAVAFAARPHAAIDSCIVAGDRKGRVVQALVVEGTRELALSVVRAVPDDVLRLSTRQSSEWALPHTLAVTNIATAGNVVAVGHGLGALELFDLRCSPGSRPVSVLHAMPFCVAEAATSAPSPGALRDAHAVTSLAFSPDGCMLSCGTNDGVVRVWSLAATAAPVASVRHRRGAVVASWSPATRGLLATGGGSLDGILAVSDTHRQSTSVPHAGSSVLAVDTASQICAIDWADGGSHIVTCHGFSREELSARTGGRLPTTRPHGAFTMPVCETPARSTCAWAVDVASGRRAVTSAASPIGPSLRPPPAAGATSAIPLAGDGGGAGALSRRSTPTPVVGAGFRAGAANAPPPRIPLAPRPGADNPASASATAKPTTQQQQGSGGNILATWEAVDVSPFDSPATESLSVPRVRTNRLDLMPLLLGGGGSSGHHRINSQHPADDGLHVASDAVGGARTAPATPTAAGGGGNTPVMPPSGGHVGDGPGGITLLGSLRSHSTRPLHMAKRARPTGEYVTASGGPSDETLRFWRPFKVVATSAAAAGCGGGGGSPFESTAASSRAATPQAPTSQLPMGQVGAHRAVSPCFTDDRFFGSCGGCSDLADDVETWR